MSNLIYLCPSCHTKIDTIPEGELAYPIERLKSIKSEHERKAREAIEAGFADVGFPELEEATRWAESQTPAAVTRDLTVVGVEAKMQKNDIGGDAVAIITMGLSVANTVAAYIESVAADDPDFPERLKAGFLSEYYGARLQGLRGSELFDAMCAFAQRGFRTYKQQAAGLAVLVHLFEACEVFEK
ncbi:MAG: hypothetical protein IT357_17630 [Gemmatimonadaceae bacterium]|nr:hypothetical protein [Gemmatimonadaceae bacterium]